MKLFAHEAAMIEEFARMRAPDECCGAVLEHPAALLRDRRANPDPRDLRTVLLFTNVQDELHRNDPVKYARTAREAFAVSPDDRLRLSHLLSMGWQVVALFHSHPDGDPRFSTFDAERAQLSPVWWQHLVVALGPRGVNELAAYKWQREIGYYARVPVQVMANPECQPA